MVIGLTGGVGCGKSTVMEILKNEYDAKILIADELGHQVMKAGTEAFCQIAETFGAGILAQDGEVDRAKLAAIVYKNDSKLKKLNAIIHPAVIAEIEKKVTTWKAEPLVVIESAILFESGLDKLCDETWGILTDKEIRVERLMKSRGYSREKAEEIMSKQLSDEKFHELCDKTIQNDKNIENLRKHLQYLLGTA